MNIYLFEFLAVLAVIVWTGGLVWLISNDVAGVWRRHHPHHDSKHPRPRR